MAESKRDRAHGEPVGRPGKVARSRPSLELLSPRLNMSLGISSITKRHLSARIRVEEQ